MRTNHRYNNFSPPYMERGGQEILRSSHTPLPPLPLSSPSRATLARAPRVARRNFIGHLLHVQYWLYESGSGWKPSNFPGFRFHDAMQIKQASAVLAQTRLCPCKLHFFFPALLSFFSFCFPFLQTYRPQKNFDNTTLSFSRRFVRGLFIIAIRATVFNLYFNDDEFVIFFFKFSKWKLNKWNVK